jgi:ubiquinone/menaquinone biosynthesis C-methylase UbiE
MDNQPINDLALLRQEYSSSARLDVRRRTHELYTVEAVDFGQWTLERLAWQGSSAVLDIGCGPGDLLLRMARFAGRGRFVGLDLSAGMVARALELRAGQPVHFLVGDAQLLPFADGTFDLVMARHVLYHVPDIDRAIASAARVLRPGGRFLAVTNSAHTMPEYRSLCQRAADRFPSVGLRAAPEERFSLENGAGWLESHLRGIETHTLTGTLRFPAASPLVDYFASSRASLMKPGHTNDEWQEVLCFFRGQAEALIRRQGHVDVTKVAAAFIGCK